MEKNYTVDETMMESVRDDAAQAPENADALSAALDAVGGGESVEEQDNAAPVQEESKALRGRMKSYEERGYKRGAREAEARWADEKRGYEERLARYEEMELRAEAKQLAQEKNMPEDIALEYLSMKKGKALQADAPAQQPRGTDGRFTRADDAQNPAQNEAQIRAAALMAQAEAFEKSSRGEIGKEAILEAFENDPDVREKVARGEWDFTDVGMHLMDKPAQRSPMAVRSPNGGRIRASSFDTMSDEDFAKFSERVANGAVFDARR